MSAAMRLGRTEVIEGLTRWFAGHLGTEVRELRDLHQHTEGFSWQTYTATVVTADGQARGYAVRREPEDGLLAPYDTAQQYRIHRAVVEHSYVPMPTLTALELDVGYLGMPFYVMERLEGHVPVQWRPDDPLAFPDEDARRQLGLEFVDVLARIHGIDWRAAGLEDLGSPADGDEAARIQIEHWDRYYTDSRLVEIPALRRAIGWLQANVATSGRVVLAHGDYRLGNFMIDGQRRINGIFDWELAHVSDPIEDIAYSGLRLFRGRSPLLSNLLLPEDYFARYEERTGLAVDEDVFRFWTVLGYLKASASHIRAARAYEDGANGDLRLAAMGHQVLHVIRGLQHDMPRSA